MTNSTLITTTQVAAILGLTRQAVIARVNAGTLTPAMKLPAAHGAYLFDLTTVKAAA